jgi:hypothetical protein
MGAAGNNARIAASMVVACGNTTKDGRGERIRTSGLYVPNVALYQAKLHPDVRRRKSVACHTDQLSTSGRPTGHTILAEHLGEARPATTPDTRALVALLRVLRRA